MSQVLRFATITLIIVMFLSSAGTAYAQEPPPLPSSFYGEVHITDFTTPVAAGNEVVAFLPGGIDPVASGGIITHAGQLVYSINVPGVLGSQGQKITFKIRQGSTIVDRVVATATWATGTNINLTIHPPAAGMSNTGPVNEASTVTIDAGTTADWQSADIDKYSFDCNNDGTFDAPQAGATTTCTFNDNGTYLVAMKVVDKQGGEDSASTTVTVNNVAPVVTGTGSSPIIEGGSFTGSGSFTDPGADTWTATVNYGDGSGSQPLTLTGKNFSLSHTYTQDGAYTVTVSVTDDDTATGTKTIGVTVTNASPVVNAGTDASINEGGTFTGSGSFTDPGADIWTATVNYGDSSGVQPLTLTGKGFNLSHPYVQDGSYTVTVTVNDDDAAGSDTLVITVNNVTPTVSAGTNATILEGGTFTRSVTFTDPGPDTWTASVDYGDGSTAVQPTITNKAFSLSHQYLKAGVHHVNISVNDGKDTGTATFDVTVTNIAPTATFNAPAAVNEGSSIALSLTSPVDPGSTVETFTYAFDCGSGYGAFSTASTGTCPTTDKGNKVVKGTIKDSNNGQNEYSATVTVNDVLPTGVSAGGPYTVGSGSPLTLTGTFTCVAADNCLVAWDLDNDTVFGEPGEMTNPVTYTWYPVGGYTVGFRVTDNDGNQSSATASVTVTGATQALTLQPGWNLVSFNLHQQDTAPGVVLSTIANKYSLIYVWLDGAWHHFDPAQGYNDPLVVLDETKGFWINITGTNPVTLTINGSVPTSTSVTLKAGWNLVGYPAANNRALPGAFSGTGFSLAYAYHANDSADPWKIYDTTGGAGWANDLTELSAGWGYWLKVGANGTWTITYP